MTKFRPDPVPDRLTPEEALARLKDLDADWQHDTEVAHSYADDVLCALLRFLGQEDAVAVFIRMNKWYA